MCQQKAKQFFMLMSTFLIIVYGGFSKHVFDLLFYVSVWNNF